MKTYSGKLLMLALTASLTVPVALLAAEPGGANAAAASKTQAAAMAPAGPMHDQMQARLQTMQARMKAMQQTEGEARMPMMAAQMEDMQTMMKDMGAGCPMAGGQGKMGQPGMPMMPGMHGSQAK